MLQSTGNRTSYFYSNFEQSIVYRNIESLSCTPETNIVSLYNNKKYLSVFKVKIKTLYLDVINMINIA